MDFVSTFSTIASYIPEEVNTVLDTVGSMLPAELDFFTVMQFLLFFGASALVFGVLSRVVLGKRSSLNHSLSSAMAILFIFALTVVVYTFRPWNLNSLLSPLPFVSFHTEYLKVFTFHDAGFTALSTELLWLVILAFLVNLLDTFIPKGKSILGWFFLRFITIVLAMLLHLAVHWAFNTYLPDFLVTYAPAILLCILAALIFMGFINLMLGVFLMVIDPIFGTIYSFFFSNIIGKQLTKAVFSSAVVTAVIFLLDKFGYSTIAINAPALLTYFPAGVILLLLWYLIGHVL